MCARGADQAASAGRSASPLGRMRYVTVFSLACACALLSGNLSVAQQPLHLPANCRTLSANGTCALYEVSIVRLLSDPDRFDGKRVALVGFVHLEFEGNAIYLHKEDLTHRIMKNALWVSFADGYKPADCQDRYVLIEGIFSAGDTGHMALFSGAVKEIDRCIPSGPQ